MKRFIGAVAAGVLVFVLPADARVRDTKEDVKNAAKKLAEQASYTYTSTTKSEGGQGGGGQGGQRPQAGPLEVKVEKDGFAVLATKIGEEAVEAVMKGGKAVIKTKDGWKTTDEIGQGGQGGGGQGGRRDPMSGFSRRLKDMKLAPADAEGLVDKVGELKAGENGEYSGDMTEEGAKALLSGGMGGGGNRAPAVTEPKGTVKFWVKDGVITKYEYNVTGKMAFGGQGGQQREINVNRTTTVEVKDVGATKVEVAEEAKKKLSGE